MTAAGIHSQRMAAPISRQSACADPLFNPSSDSRSDLQAEIARDIRGKNTSDNIPETNAATQSAQRQIACTLATASQPSATPINSRAAISESGLNRPIDSPAGRKVSNALN